MFIHQESKDEGAKRSWTGMNSRKSAKKINTMRLNIDMIEILGHCSKNYCIEIFRSQYNTDGSRTDCGNQLELVILS